MRTGAEEGLHSARRLLLFVVEAMPGLRICGVVSSVPQRSSPNINPFGAVSAALRFSSFTARTVLSASAWCAVFAVLGLVEFLVVRSCGYQLDVVARYAAYFAAHVVLPGVVVLCLVHGRSVSLTTAVALGVPTGFAVEIFSFLGLSALQLKELLPYLPLAWLTVGALWWRRRGRGLLRSSWTQKHAALALALSGLFLGMVLGAVSQMFAESPLVGGLPQRAIFHDWVYLVSRAAAIKHYWPLEDPSLAGTDLQYHYFMLVHAASASTVTGLEVTVVLLRLMIVPLCAVLVLQTYALGRLLARSPWAGVVAALMTVAVSEMSFSENYGQPMFLGLFIRWLYVSPTFFFGVGFFGALMLAVAHCTETRRFGWRETIWLGALAVAGTGAKGTVLPVLLLGMGFWGIWQWFRDRAFPRRIFVMGTVMTTAFGAVYFSAMREWGSGEASFDPFRVLQVTQFWKDYAAVWESRLAAWLPPLWGSKLAVAGCALVVIAGTAGVRLLALAYLTSRHAGHRAQLACWLGAVFAAACAMGLLMHLDSYGELYLILLIRVPMAILAAAFCVSGFQRLRRVWREQTSAAVLSCRGFALRWKAWASGGAVAVVALTLVLQTGMWVTRNRDGFTNWLRLSPNIKVDAEMIRLHEVMLWVRQNTEKNAVLVANAFTPVNIQHGRGSLVDQTTAGVHYYYSALSERRLWVEGPTYLLNGAKAVRRMQRAAEIFYGGQTPVALLEGAPPCYALIDRNLGDGARVALPERHRVFRSERFEIYRLPRQPLVVPATKTIARLIDE